jgi:hypothetical protein
MSGRSRWLWTCRVLFLANISFPSSRFGLAFQTAAEESGAGAKHDRFDTSIVEVKKDDLTSFIECLHLRSA